MSATIDDSACLADSRTCVHHFHDADPSYLQRLSSSHTINDAEAAKHEVSETSDQPETGARGRSVQQTDGHAPIGLRKVILIPSLVPSLDFPATLSIEP